MTEKKRESIEITAVITSPGQNLCISCGLCCDGTIFVWAPLTPEDEKGDLEGFVVGRDSEKGGAHFDLPCRYLHERKCALYQSWRPHVCGAFRCKTLRRFEAGEIDLLEAQTTIERTTELAARVWAQMRARAENPEGSLGGMFLAWKEKMEQTGAAWMQEHQQFLLDFAALQYRLDKGFRLNKKDPAAMGEPLQSEQ